LTFRVSPEETLMRVTAEILGPYRHDLPLGESRLACGLVISDGDVRARHYGQLAPSELCLDESLWARQSLSSDSDLVSPSKLHRPAGWIFSLGQEGLVWNISRSNPRASISRRWFGGDKG
jgi:hypothetical protein